MLWKISTNQVDLVRIAMDVPQRLLRHERLDQTLLNSRQVALLRRKSG